MKRRGKEGRKAGDISGARNPAVTRQTDTGGSRKVGKQKKGKKA